jgi:hypothetical protein
MPPSIPGSRPALTKPASRAGRTIERRMAMIHRPNLLRVPGSLLLAAFLGCLSVVGCDEDGPSHPSDFCWTNVDTLYASGVAVADTSAVRAAFQAYILSVVDTQADFPSDEDWTYLTSRPFHAWQGRFYWQVDHEVYDPGSDSRLMRRLVYVDQNGVVVWPYGCI